MSVGREMIWSDPPFIAISARSPARPGSSPADFHAAQGAGARSPPITAGASDSREGSSQEVRNLNRRIVSAGPAGLWRAAEASSTTVWARKFERPVWSLPASAIRVRK